MTVTNLIYNRTIQKNSISNKCRSKIYSLQVDYKVTFKARHMQIYGLIWIRISCPCTESKDLRCKCLNTVHMGERADQKQCVNLQIYVVHICGYKCFIPFNVSYFQNKKSVCICRILVTASVIEFRF